jgi:hypothetical protein
MEKADSSYINKTSYVENCETSAWGRALANFAIGVDASVASADEVANAIKKESLIPNATLPLEEIEEIERIIFDTELKADKAAALIEYLKDNSVDPDPRKQFEKRF